MLFVSSCQQSFYVGILSSADGRTPSNSHQPPSRHYVFCNVRPANIATDETNGRRVPDKKRLPARPNSNLHLHNCEKTFDGVRRRESKKMKNAWL